MTERLVACRSPEGFDEFVGACSYRLFRVGCPLTYLLLRPAVLLNGSSTNRHAYEAYLVDLGLSDCDQRSTHSR